MSSGKKPAAAATRLQILPAIFHFAVDGLQSALGIVVAGTKPAVLQEGLDVQAFVTRGQEQPNQTATQDGDADQQFLLELAKTATRRSRKTAPGRRKPPWPPRGPRPRVTGQSVAAGLP